MTEGKILKWKIQPGDSFTVGDALFSIETDKATIDYEAT
jgi:pyruvate/2-oxoglutarate dehydrogenase complex dihydrolipoamide acyltransferase (E2) component